MSPFRRRPVVSSLPPPPPPPTKSVVSVTYVGDATDSHLNGFQENKVTVRTVTYSGSMAAGGSYTAMYRRQPAVRAVVDFLSRNIAQLNAKVYERLDNADRLELDGHPLAVLLRKPNPVTTRYAHMRDTVADLAIHDRAYWLKIRSGRNLAVQRIPVGQITVEEVNGRRAYRYEDRLLTRQDLVIFPGYSPGGSDDGVSPLETLRRVLQDEAAAQQHRENMWLNAARQSGFIERPLEAPEWSDAARARFRSDVEATLAGGENAGRIGVLEEGMTWNASSFSPEQTQYIEGRRLTYEEVAITYFGPVGGRALLEATAAGTESNHRQLYQDVLGPWLRFLQDEIELQVLPEFEPLNRGESRIYVEFNLAEKLKGSFEEQGKMLTTAAGVPYMGVNEARARVNLPRIDDPVFDMPVQPLNVMYGGQPAVTIPTEDPSTAAALPAGFGIKAAPAAALRRRDRAAKEHEELFRSFFERQERFFTSAKAFKADSRERWDRELAADLYRVGLATVREAGENAAAQLAGVFVFDQTWPYLAESARIAAESVNAHTWEDLEESDDIAHTFEVAKTARAEQLGMSRAAVLINFARTEAAKHSEANDGRQRTKTWVVTSRKSRHPEMNGQTVPVSKTFSNGLMWPGDGSADQSAGCRCLLQLS